MLCGLTYFFRVVAVLSSLSVLATSSMVLRGSFRFALMSFEGTLVLLGASEAGLSFTSFFNMAQFS